MNPEIRREYLVILQRPADSGNGYDFLTVAEFPEGKTEPLGAFEVYREGRTGKVWCENSNDFNNFHNCVCGHAAVVRTYLRQGEPEGRLYFVTWTNRVGCWKSGKKVFLSKVSQICGPGIKG